MNYHILEVSDKEDEARVAFHIAVPNENNFAGINLQVALKQHLDSPERRITGVPWLQVGDPTEYAAVENGAVYEHVETVEFDAHLTNVQKRDLIDARYNFLATLIPDRIRARLRFWGLDRMVP